MRPFVHGPQAVACDVRVDLRRSHIGVSEQLLNSSEIGPPLEEMGGVGVPQGVGVQEPAVREGVAGEDPPDVAGGHAPAPGVDDRSASFPGRSGRRAPVGRPEVRPDGLQRGLPEREPPHLGALAEDGDGRPAAVDVGDVEAATFADPEPGAVEELEDGQVAKGPRVVGPPRPSAA